MSDDATLLRHYVDEHSQDAFAELVNRHLALVYQAARRQTGGNNPLAEEIAQTVFSDLARKARSLLQRPSLAGWLYTSTRHTAAQALRTESRRRLREQKAYLMTTDNAEAGLNDKTAWLQIRPVLDDALQNLGERDREAVLLRCIEQHSFAEIGGLLDLSPDAARMRVERSLEKVRRSLARRGVTSTAVALGLTLAAQAGAAAPAGLAAQIASSAFTLQTAAAGGTALGLFTYMTTSKIVSGIAVAIAVLAVGVVVHEKNQTRQNAAALESALHRESTLQARVAHLEKTIAAESARAKTAEETNAKLLAQRDQPGAKQTSAQPAAPLTVDYVTGRYKQAQQLAKAGRSQKALQNFLWCFDEGMRSLSSYTGVRLSFLLSQIATLGESYPPALAALRERQQRAEQRVQASATDSDAAMEWASLNRVFKEDARTLALYETLPKDDDRKSTLGSSVYDLLTDARRYSEAAEAMPYRSMINMVEALSAVPKNAAAAKSGAAAPGLEVTAKYVEVLAGSGDLAGARDLSELILSYNGSAETRAILQQHATRAGHPELFAVAPTPAPASAP